MLVKCIKTSKFKINKYLSNFVEKKITIVLIIFYIAYNFYLDRSLKLINYRYWT